MTLILDAHPQSQKSKKHKSSCMVIIGNGPAFLQTVIMQEGRDVLPVTNNDADYLTLERLGFFPVKKDFQASSLSFIRENPHKVILLTSLIHSNQLIRSVESVIRKDQVLLMVRYPKMRKVAHPYTFILDTADLFDNLWSRCMALYRLTKIHEFLKTRIPENQKTLKLLNVFFGPPDPDAIASSIAFCKLFSKEVVPTFASTAKVKRFENRALLSYLKVNVLDIASVNFKDFHAVACFDAQPSFFVKSGYQIPFDICLDHHPEAIDNPELPIWDVRKNYGACSTILAQYYYYSKKKLAKTLATALLFGIRADTVNFSRSTYEPDIDMMAFLYKKVDRKILKKFEFSKVPKRALKYFKRAYNRYVFEGSSLFCHLGRVGYLDIGSIIAEHFLKIQKVHFSLISCIYREKVYVFFRSVSDQWHAGEFASEIFKGYGVGGGHKEMGRAECLLANLPYPQKSIENKFHDFMKRKISSSGNQ